MAVAPEAVEMVGCGCPRLRALARVPSGGLPFRNRPVSPKVVPSSGTFGVFLVGHVRVPQRTAELGDRLVVAVWSEALNGSKRGQALVFNEDERLEIISSLRVVDAVFLEESLAKKPTESSRIRPTSSSWVTTRSAGSTGSRRRPGRPPSANAVRVGHRPDRAHSRPVLNRHRDPSLSAAQVGGVSLGVSEPCPGAPPVRMASSMAIERTRRRRCWSVSRSLKYRPRVVSTKTTMST